MRAGRGGAARPVTGGTRWNLPGGGIEHGEDPRDAAVREVAEETGLEVELGPLIGVDSRLWTDHPPNSVHAIRILYTGEITGGTLRHETNGSSDRAEWIKLTEVLSLDRSRLIDTALAAARPT